MHLQLQEPQASQMKALRSSLEKARELKLNNQAMEGNAGGVDKSQQQMVMELYQKCATLKVCLAPCLLPCPQGAKHMKYTAWWLEEINCSLKQHCVQYLAVRIPPLHARLFLETCHVCTVMLSSLMKVVPAIAVYPCTFLLYP